MASARRSVRPKPTPGDAPGKRSKPSARTFRDAWSDELAGRLGRALRPAELRALESIDRLFGDLVRRGGQLHFADLQNRGFLLPTQVGRDPAEVVSDAWWNPGDVPKDAWQLWRFVAHEYLRAGVPVPEALALMADPEATAAAVKRRRLQRELDRWEAWPPHQRVERRPTMKWAAVKDVRLAISEEGAFFLEVRPSHDDPWHPAPIAVLVAIPGLLPKAVRHLSAPEGALMLALAAGLKTQRRTGLGVLQTRRPVPEWLVAAVLSVEEARAAVVLPDGSPWHIEAEPLVYEGVASHDVAERLDLRLVDPHGRPAPTAKRLTNPPEVFYFNAGKIYRGPGPLPATHVSRLAASDPAMRERLLRHGVKVSESQAVAVKTVPLRPVLRVWTSPVTDALALPALLFVHLLARSEDPPCERIWTGRGWTWSEQREPPLRHSGDPIWEFDHRAANAVGAFFADFKLGWDHGHNAWARPLPRVFPEEFLQWRDTLPPGCEIEALGELSGLFGPVVQARMDWSLQPAAGGGRDWFDLQVGLHIDNATLTPAEVALLLRSHGKWVRLREGGWRRVEIQGLGAAGDALERLGLGSAETLAEGRTVSHRLHAVQLLSEAEELASRDRALADELRERARRMAALPPPQLPAGLQATLRPYQEEGFRFLVHLSEQGFGGVLADDMGLGKTVQTLAWMLHLALDKRDESDTSSPGPTGARRPWRALVVCPKSVMHGWVSETARFAPALATAVFSPFAGPGDLTAAGPGIVVANYVQLRLQGAWFQGQTWDAVVLDEAQFIKNPASQTAVIARTLRSRHRLALTGTPIENRLLDLWSLFAFAQPGLLGTQSQFRRSYGEENAAASAQLHRRVRHFILRRTKAQVATDLPSRTEDEIVVTLEGEQRLLYDAELKRARAHLLGVDTDRALDAVRFNVLASLLRLRQICCHPGLIDPSHAALPSAKLDGLVERLEELAEEGHQVLVFSQFVGMLELIRDRLVGAGIRHLMLTGATENRQELVAQFQSDRSQTVFLLSLRAAGFGLNLTAASYVFLYDPWWNPAVEAQAIDRTHRIGQTQPVVAYRLLAENTIEAKIRLLQREKADLASSVVQEESLASVMDLESLRRILE
ncbi:MAG: DEAD/DEAH box helicase [Opitutaceae bacterium]|nr:DEAD/DEAH box helicase [Opitutaceae bacterium]